MFTMWPRDFDWSWHLLRPIAEGIYDGVDLYDTYPPIRNQLRWLTGAKDLDDARERLKAFSLKGVVEKISCPLLVVHGEDDHLVPAWHAERTVGEARTDKQLILYKRGEPRSMTLSASSGPVPPCSVA